jgi:hypothetical protein
MAEDRTVAGSIGGRDEGLGDVDEPSGHASDAAFHARFIWFLTILSGAVLWLRPLASSFWLDELVTWWVVKDAASDVLHRAYDFQGQSIAYYLIIWLVRHIGQQEWMLRLPSLLAVILAAFFMYRLALRLIDREFARVTVFVFVVWPGIVFEASNARPYAMAVLLVVAAALALVRWLDQPSAGRLLVFTAVAASIGYAHILFVFVLPAFLLYAFRRSRTNETAVRARSIILAFGLVAVVDLGLAWQTLALLGRRETINLPGTLSVDWLAGVVAPTGIFSALVVGGALAQMIKPWRLDLPAGHNTAATTLVLGWLFIPLAIEVSLALATHIHLLEPRYALMSAPAMVLVIAAFLRSVVPAESRRIVAAIVAISAVLALSGTLKYGEDWQWASSAAAAATTPHTVVLLHPGLVESAQLDWFPDAERRSYLETPTAYYPFAASMLPVPYLATPEALAFLDRELSNLPSGTDRLLFVTRYAADEFQPYLDGWLSSHGWTVGPVRRMAAMVVAEYDRGPT